MTRRYFILGSEEMSMRHTQQGFTLIELVIVIVVLGILAAFAVPRFISLQTPARVAAVNGLAGAIRSASSLIHGLALANQITSGSVSAEGAAITVNYAYPTGDVAGIVTSLQDTSGFTVSVSAGAVTFTSNGAPTPANCNVTYTAPTVSGTAPIITTTTSGC
jgi:MSHA pilin protein MshA